MNVLFSVVLLKINLLTLLTNHDTEKQNSKHKRRPLPAVRNLLASRTATDWVKIAALFRINLGILFVCVK